MPRKPNNFIAGYQSPKQQAEYNTLAMDALYDRIIDFFRADPLLHDSNDGSITARILTAETVYHPTTYQPHGVLITLKDAKRTQYMLRIQRADLSQDTSPAPPVLEAHVEPKKLPPMSSEQRAELWSDANKVIDADVVEETATVASVTKPKTPPPDYWMVLPWDCLGHPLYARSLEIGECPTVQKALEYADEHLNDFPDHRILIIEGYRPDFVD